MSKDEIGEAIGDALLAKPYRKPRKKLRVFAKMTKEQAAEWTTRWLDAGVAARAYNHPTQIELMVRHVLDAKKIFYIPEFPIGGRMHVDIYIPSIRTVVEVDGQYWHSRRGAKGRDYRRDIVVKSFGYVVVRLPEEDIKKGAKKALTDGLNKAGIRLKGVTDEDQN